MVYKWKDGIRLSADAQKVGEELESIEQRDAQTVVAIARKKKSSELHKCFEWDDSKAAEEYRLTQARYILRFIVTEVECSIKGKPEVVRIRAFESVRLPHDDDEKRPMVYLPTIQALGEPEYREQIIDGLEETIAEAAQTAEKYSHIVPQFSRTRTLLEEARLSVRA